MDYLKLNDTTHKDAYQFPRIDDVQSTSKDYDSMKEDDDEKANVKIDDEGFKIPQ